MDSNQPTPLPALTKSDLPEIIARYRQGESLQDLAKHTPVEVRQLYNWILAETGQEYDKIQTECLVNRIADADVMMMESETILQIARAREMCRFTRMDFERRRPQLYGPKQELAISQRVTVVIHRPTAEVDKNVRVLDVMAQLP